MMRFLMAGALLAAVLALPPFWYAVLPTPAPALPPPGRLVGVSPGLSVNLIEAGVGPPVLLVHGHRACAYDWTPTIRELSATGHRVFAYDRIGYGYSNGRAPARVTVETNAAELLSLLATLDLHDVTIVGWSYGGRSPSSLRSGTPPASL